MSTRRVEVSTRSWRGDSDPRLAEARRGGPRLVSPCLASTRQDFAGLTDISVTWKTTPCATKMRFNVTKFPSRRAPTRLAELTDISVTWQTTPCATKTIPGDGLGEAIPTLGPRGESHVRLARLASTRLVLISADNPKTILNHNNDVQKRGIYIALRRADTNFRTTKSRALKKLTLRKDWSTLSEDTQDAMREEIIEGLEQKRDALKAKLEKEWFLKVQEDEVNADENDLLIDNDEQDEDKNEEAQGAENEIEEASMDEEEEWGEIISDEDEWDGILSNDEMVDKNEVNKRVISNVFQNYGEKWTEKMDMFEDKAREKWGKAD